MRKYLVSAFWWTITVLTLFILDDLVFGPVFWTIAVWNQLAATVIAFAASWAFGMWLIIAGMRPAPSRAASFLLKRLMLERKNEEIAAREASIRKQAWSVAGAFLVTPLIGAVIPVLLLNKKQAMSHAQLLRLALVLTALYATEFALIHGGYGLGAIAHSIF